MRTSVVLWMALVVALLGWRLGLSAQETDAREAFTQGEKAERRGKYVGATQQYLNAYIIEQNDVALVAAARAAIKAKNFSQAANISLLFMSNYEKSTVKPVALPPIICIEQKDYAELVRALNAFISTAKGKTIPVAETEF